MDKDDAPRDKCSGVMEIPELVEIYQEPRNRREDISTHRFETPEQRPNEILKELDNDPSTFPSTEDSFIGACAPNEQSEDCLDGREPQTAGCELQDVSSILSDQESDMKEKEILQEALLQLKRENLFGFADTCSECSDDLSETDRRSDSCCSRTQTALKNAVENNVHETPIKASEREISQWATELGETSFQDATKPGHRNQLHILRRMLQSPTSERDEREEKHLGVPKINDGFSGSDSPDSGYISDIAVLARENEKLSEIIDHLQMQVPSYPHEDDGCLELMDRYVGKEQYDIVESERFELESKLRDKDRRIREQERTAEEEQYEHEEECRILNHSLTKAERKFEEKTKELENCEAKMKEATTKHLKQLNNLQSELESARQDNFKLEETILVLQKHNADFEREMQGMKQHIVKLEALEEQLDERYRRDVGQLEEYLDMESQEKNKLKQNAEALRQELLQTKAMMLEEAGKRVVEEQKLDSKQKTGNEKFGVLGRQVPTTSTSCMIEAGAQVLEETLLAESGATQEGIEHKADIEKRIQEEQQRRTKLEEENKAMSTALKGMLSGDHSLLQTLFSDDTFSKLDVKSIQRKLSETLKELNEVQLKNEEAEAEVKHLKRKTEHLEKDAAQMRELERGNEELNVELERANRKLRELQRAAGSTREEMEEMTQTIRRLKDDNLTYKDETERLRVKIKHTEELLADAKTQVAKSLEEENMAVLHELKTKQDETERRNKRLEVENDTLRQDLQKTDETIRASEETFSAERRALIAGHTKELEDMKEKCALKQQELNRTAKTVREVTEEWEKMLRETVSRNEEKLQRLGEEKLQVQEELRRKTQEMDRQLKLCKCKPEQPSHDREENCPSESVEKRVRHVKSDVEQKPQNQGTNEMADNVQAERRDLAKYSPGADIHTKEEQADQIQTLSRKHELEMKELRKRLSNESKEARESLKVELTRSLVMKSVILESRIEGLVVQKVQEQKQRNRRQVVQHEREKEQYNITMRRLKDKIRMYEAERRTLEEHKGELEVTVSRLRNELRSSKEEANERREREAKKMEEEFEMEKQKLQEISEKRIERTKEKMEEEYCRKTMSERRGYEGEIQELTAAVMLLKEQVEVRDPKCKECSKNDMSEPAESSTKDPREIKELEQEHERKVRKETENMSDTLESLRREIERLKAHRQQLQTGVYDRRDSNNRGLQHAYPMNVDTTQFLVGMENDSHQQVHHERSVLKERTTELEIEVERLHQEMNQQEARSRREHVHMRRRFQSEKEEIEEEFRREKNGWRAQMSVLATKANLRRVQTAFDGGRITTKRNIDAFLRNHVTRTRPVHVEWEDFTAAPATTKTCGIAFT